MTTETTTSWHCPACDRRWLTPDSVVALFHRCPAWRSRDRRATRRPPIDIDRVRGDRRVCFDALLEANGGESSIWRPIADEDTA